MSTTAFAHGLQHRASRTKNVQWDGSCQRRYFDSGLAGPGRAAECAASNGLVADAHSC